MTSLFNTVNNTDKKTVLPAEAKLLLQMQELTKERLPLLFPVKSRHFNELKKELGQNPATLLQYLCYLLDKFGVGFQRFLTAPKNSPNCPNILKHMNGVLTMSERTLFRVADTVRVQYRFERGVHLDTLDIDFQGKFFASFYQSKNSERSLVWYPNRPKIDALVRKINAQVEAKTKATIEAKSTSKIGGSHLPTSQKNELPNRTNEYQDLPPLAGDLAVSNNLELIELTTTPLSPLTRKPVEEKTEAIFFLPTELKKKIGQSKPYPISDEIGKGTKTVEVEIQEGLQDITTLTTCQITPPSDSVSGVDCNSLGAVDYRNEYDTYRDVMAEYWPARIVTPSPATKRNLKNLNGQLSLAVRNGVLPADTTLDILLTAVISDWPSFRDYFDKNSAVEWQLKKWGLKDHPNTYAIAQEKCEHVLQWYLSLLAPAAKKDHLLEEALLRKKAREQERKSKQAVEDAACPYVAKYGQRVKNQAGITFARGMTEGTSGKDWTLEEMLAERMRGDEKSGTQPSQDQLGLIKVLEKQAVCFQTSMREVEQYKTRGATLLPPCIKE